MSERRTVVQALSTLLTNGYVKGFVTGNIYTGPLKHVCVPTLNCYSCPGALCACPVGAVQVVLAGGGGFDPTAPHTIWTKLAGILSGAPVFVIGFLTLLAAFVGRASCGWLCPFGWFQDLVHRIPVPFTKRGGGARGLHYLKYLILVGMVVLMPLFLVDSFGFSEPYFCKLVCPAGTLEGGLLLPILQPDLRGMLGKLFAWKVSLLVLLIGLMTVFRRPFCNWLCPLGAWFGPFNRISLYRLEFDKNKCVQCGLCMKVCPSGLDPVRECDSSDCVRCLDCGHICPKQAIAVRGPGLPSATTSRPADAVPPSAPGTGH
ncbi:MAG TPA: 4Fe-4S binding protein [Candidatus Ozemobacteraceae bacterium]